MFLQVRCGESSYSKIIRFAMLKFICRIPAKSVLYLKIFQRKISTLYMNQLRIVDCSGMSLFIYRIKKLT